ncbi:lysophospholipid acyltransferase family protein [Elizabethkingia ursingii]|uniref:Lipid A biosynthesis acyltransferase n=1 Tax=Elizabethkingia ursingii TaxID=1756150 RepID=A0AAJ3NFC8_9FLAO|nr:lysophospholipid acyltransferase family protein [Elizabethkingia ursingii]AQX10837.1 lipid A biosynthesis acyltransferase [Elizabethkingia ursingii]KUY26627.1 lipid A biosynthesis acyltransferase [Elizabethkingia ursingii]MCL1664739.1 lysophospholipid acyltransferase family protein [Elizabethkingia ursingii]OPB79145.1 lipid A biosynthesis acyltransferase [Elizabethkingia ursingii]OPB94867.1 lipid A biosynthesis acyltransferase [Elizabethkingia ursingii]
MFNFIFLNKFLFQIILLFSRLPLWFLYGLSDILYYANLYIVGYRKNVVTENLKNSFPEKSDEEIAKIRRQFFRNFFDYIFEMLKAFTISETELRVRMQHLNLDVFQEAYDEKKDIIFLAGHVFNWEWINALAKVIPQKSCHPVYRKVQSSFWEEKIKFVRNRFGNKALETKEVIRSILQDKDNGNSAYMFVADQTPHVKEIHYGLEFLNQKTPAFIGYDKLSTKKDLAFIYCDMKKVKRGFYQVNYYRIYPDGEKFVQYEVVNKFHKLLENTIRKRPDNWLWSHRRWKYKDALK